MKTYENVSEYAHALGVTVVVVWLLEAISSDRAATVESIQVLFPNSNLTFSA